MDRIECFLGILTAYSNVGSDQNSGKLAYYLACQLFPEPDVRATFRRLVAEGSLAISADWFDYSGGETESMSTLL